uniref:Uncharacterized protein n=1 Tax=Oryza glumipatula TaxID=40148 RepID=A0A0E0AIC0_9ORYZ
MTPTAFVGFPSPFAVCRRATPCKAGGALGELLASCYSFRCPPFSPSRRRSPLSPQSCAAGYLRAPVPVVPLRLAAPPPSPHSTCLRALPLRFASSAPHSARRRA